MTSKKPVAPMVKKDPANRRTVILDRWPTEAEKNGGVRDAIRKMRVGK